MKNLLIFISPTSGFDKEHEELTKIQIDNSLELGWKPEDIILATNFDWEYRGVKALSLTGDFKAFDGNRSSKILVINRLFDMGKIRDGDTVWFHDHDAFQLEPMKELSLYPVVAAFTDHGWSKTWNAGSFFFTRGAADLFQKIYDTMIERGTNEQDALTFLWENGLENYQLLNITYNLNIHRLNSNVKKADRPLMVAHFHPHKTRHLDLFRSLLPNRLLTIFKNYGIK
jgi:hypothetical protein